MRDKLLPVSNMASSRSEENVNPNHFQHQMVSQCHKYQEDSNKEKEKEVPVENSSNPNNKTQESLPPKDKGGYTKWVHNLSKTPLTEDQEKVLARGPNFAIVTKPPVGEYISQIERVCQQLDQGKVEELRGETKAILKNIRPPKPNISKREEKAIQELRKDQGKIILTADKGWPWLCWRKMTI